MFHSSKVLGGFVFQCDRRDCVLCKQSVRSIYFSNKKIVQISTVEGCIFYATNISVFFATKYSLKRGFCFMQQFSEAEAPRLCCDSYQVALWQPTLGGAPEANCPARLVLIFFVFCFYFVFCSYLC